MNTIFHVIDKQQGIMQCHYCNNEQSMEQVTLISD